MKQRDISAHTAPELPVITGIYDPVSRRRDGTITSQAPIIVSGQHLNEFDLNRMHLCLVSSGNPDCIIDVTSIYKCDAQQVIVVLPCLTPDIYHPALRLCTEKAAIHVLPNTWEVKMEHVLPRI